MEQGSFRQTDNPLDMALSGRGFFKVNTGAGTRYTRNGNFQVDLDGRLVTSVGDPVMGESGPIVVGDGNVTVDATGGISVDGEEVDRLSIVTFDEKEQIKKDYASYYVYTGERAERQPEDTVVRHKFLEGSNVVVTEEVIKMIETLRHFESYQKVLQTFDETDGKLINEVGKL